MTHYIKTFFMAAMLLSVTSAHALELTGNKTQGGVLFGKTVPGSTVYWENEPKLPKAVADADGRFVVGVSRLQKADSALIVNLMGGIEERHAVKIKQRNYKTQRIKGVKKKHVNPYANDMVQIRSDKKQILDARAKSAPSETSIFGSFIQPSEGVITGVYGSRRFFNGEERSAHKGLDIANKIGTTIKAPADGVVTLALPMSFFNGNLVIVDHGYNMMTIYAHMNSMSVKKGQKVKQGDVLGEVGSTGRSTGPHLHWGLYWRNIALDPELLLNK